jgi:hypothetical protein
LSQFQTISTWARRYLLSPSPANPHEIAQCIIKASNALIPGSGASLLVSLLNVGCNIANVVLLYFSLKIVWQVFISHRPQIR